MAKYITPLGDEYSVKFTVGLFEMLKTNGIDLLDMNLEVEGSLTKLENDDTFVASVVYLVFKDKFAESGITEQMYKNQVDGTAAKTAYEFLRAGLLDFFQKRGQSLKAEILEIYPLIQEEILKQMKERLDLSQVIGEPFTNTQELSVSTPTDLV